MAGRLPPDEMLRPAAPQAAGAFHPSETLDLDCPDPVGIHEIAERHGTTPGTIRSWRKRHADFPQPLAQLAMGPLFDWHEVKEWLKTRRSGGTTETTAASSTP